MFGELTSDEIDTLLREEVVARIAYVDRRGLPCIVPVNYAYDGAALYGYSLLGAKVENMGANASVCVEVDRIQNAAEWCSVIVRGTFEALLGSAALDAIARISERMKDVADATGAPAMAGRTYVKRRGGDGIAYRILVHDASGRYATLEANE
jgi:nitroimidazol reductase NimA-like FMN-containing flavoprotein (pyridoxamine 5'-phosphate oxidase superfamily)